MAYIKLQGETERQRGVYYVLDNAQEPLGAGGMGQVFRGIQVDESNGAKREVAIKAMYTNLPPSAIERAHREASIQLRNDNLIEMLGFIETVENTVTGPIKHYHVVSELLQGISPSNLLDGHTTDGQGEDMPFAVKMLQDYRNDPEHFAIFIVTNVLSGLLALHDAGYIHRDIDPSNIMLTADGHVKLIDFGIAKQMNNLTTNDKSLTVAGSFMGKPEYAAPELATGDIKSQNQTTDVYAMGILLYECIVGHVPFEGPRHEVLDKQLHAKLPLGVIKNKGLREIISIACEKKQELRYQSAAQMRVALETMGGVRRVMSPKKRMAIAASVGAFVVVLAAVAFVVVGKQKAAKEKQLTAEFEQRKTEFVSLLNAQTDAADRKAAIGFNTTEGYNEDALIEAYALYGAIDSLAVDAQTYAIALPNIAGRQADIVNLLDTICVSLQAQAAGMEELGETDMAALYSNRAQKISDFLINTKQ